MNTPHNMATGRSLALDWRHAREKLAAGLGMPGWMLFDEAGHGGRRPAGVDDVPARRAGNSVAPLLPDFVRVTCPRDLRAGLHPIVRLEDRSRRGSMPLLRAFVRSVFRASATRMRVVASPRRETGMASSAGRRSSASRCGATDIQGHEGRRA